MRHAEIARLLNEALLYCTCAGRSPMHFDHHSTLDLQMADLPSINVADVQGDVVVWSRVMDVRPELLRHSAVELLQILLQGFPWSRSGQLHLREVEGQLELRLLTNEQALSTARHFGQALDHFMAVQEELCTILRP
ncbi:InvB/SpaK family type III secretion system chaperone [Pseudomonas sp. LB3P31]